MYSLHFCSSLYKSLISHYKYSKFDIIVAREPKLAGPIAFLIAKLIKTKLIVEINGNYSSPYVWENTKTRSVRQLKRNLSSRIISFVLKRASGIKILYEGQANAYLEEELLDNKVVSLFHDYTPISLFQPSSLNDKVI
jgi:hypothetical protein